MYDNYSGALYSVVLNIVPNKELANDVLQEVFVNIYRRIETYDASKSRLYTWMLNIARNESIDTLRSKSYRNTQQNREVTENVYELAGTTTQKIDTIGLKKIVEKIKPEYQQLIELSYFKGYTHDEISQMTGTPLGTVKTRLRAALVQLRSLVGS